MNFLCTDAVIYISPTSYIWLNLKVGHLKVKVEQKYMKDLFTVSYSE